MNISRIIAGIAMAIAGTSAYCSTPLPVDPTPGDIVSETPGPFSTQVLTLSNGIKVYLRPSDRSPEEVLIRGIGPGGLSVNYDTRNPGKYKMVDDILTISNYAGLDPLQLRKLLGARKAKGGVKIGNMAEELEVETTPEDLEVALSLLYLKATALEKNEKNFEKLLAKRREALMKPDRTAAFAMGDSIHAYVFNHHSFNEKVLPGDLDLIDYDAIIEMWKDRFSDMSDFTFIITGNYEADSIRPLIKKYIASYPGGGRKDRPKDVGYGYHSGEDKYVFSHPASKKVEPKSIVYTFFNGECPYNLENVLLAQGFGIIYRDRLLKELRDGRNLTKVINSHCSVTTGFNGPDTPSRFILPVYMKVEPGHEEEAFGIVRSTLSDLMNENPTADEIEMIKGKLEKEISTNRSENGYWATVIEVYDHYGEDMDSGYEAVIDRMSPKVMGAFARRYLSDASHLELTMEAEKGEAKSPRAD